MSIDQSVVKGKKLINEYEPSLEPIDRFSEIIFGLIMVLTFTCSLSAASSGKQEIRTMLWTAVGCNLAWGIVDAMMFLMGRMVDKAEKGQMIRKIKTAKSNQEIDQSVKGAIPPFMADTISTKHIHELHDAVLKIPDLPARPFVSKKELLNAGVIFLLVFTSTFPVIIPFFFLQDNPMIAIRVSNGIAILLLFIGGYVLGRKTGYPAWLSGLLFTVIGLALVFMTIALGG